MNIKSSASEQHPIAIAEIILMDMGLAGRYVWRKGQELSDDPDERAGYLKFALDRLQQRVQEGEGKYLELPVDPCTFAASPYLMDMGDEIYPKVMDEIVEVCSGKYVEGVFTGGIGTGKTTIALMATAYTLYELSCLTDPHKEFGLAKSSEIEFVFQNIQKSLAKAVDYDRFKAMVDQAPYFQNEYMYDRSIESEMRFPNRVIVKPLSGEVTASIGQNIFGGVIDEINYMAIVENSKASIDGGMFDQANQIYNSIARRRQSRFMKQGRLPGMLCLVSSKKYPGEFTDRKIAEARTDPTIYVFDKRPWDVKPEGTFTGKWFHVFVGDETRRPRILEPGEKDLIAEDDAHLVVPVPIEYRPAFHDDLLSALRDIAGVSTLALHPYMLNTEAVAACFGTCESIISRPDCDFVSTNIMVYPKRIQHPKEPRFAHIDLALTGDSCGMAVGHVTGFTEISRGPDISEWLPIIQYDFVLEIRPPRGGEINFEKVRQVLYTLQNMGMHIKWATLDSYQSRDTMQMLIQKKIMAGYRSMDTDCDAYDILKQALYDGRVIVPEHAKALSELVRLERDPKTLSIDHPPVGSKDCSDAMAGVAFGLTMRRELWVRHRIPYAAIPQALLDKEGKGKGSITTKELEPV